MNNRRAFVGQGVCIVALLVPLLGCGPEGFGDESVEQVSDNLYGLPSTYWTGSPPFVNVCWEPSTFNNSAYATQRQWVEDAQRRNWARFARLNLVAANGFTNWQACSSGQPGIHAWLSPLCQGQASLSGLGKPNHDGLNNGLRLPDCVATSCRMGGTQEACVKSVSMHEFGHALGFYHEEERPNEGLADCNGDPRTFTGGVKYGAYNVSSPMAECLGPPVMQISPGDIAASQRAYGRRIRGSIVSTVGRCVASLGSALGQFAFMWDCDEFENDQEWDYAVNTQKVTVSGNTSLCLGVQSGSPTQPAKLITCSDSSQGIEWRFQNAYIRGYGMCLDLAGGNTSGGLVQSWTCGALSGSNQRWTLTSAGEIRFGNQFSNSCLTVPSSGSGQLTVTTCSGNSRQKFGFGNSNQQITSSAFPSKCIDVASVLDSSYVSGVGLPAHGAAVTLFDCLSGQFNQKWNFSGQVFNLLHARCLSRDSDDNGASLHINACSTTDERQRFDYYPL
jgi:hypothetical protein